MNTAPLSHFSPHPDLQRITMMEDVQAFMAKNHHGDSRRKEVADELADEWNAFVSELQEQGVREPVKVIPGKKKDHWEIVDGRHRWKGSGEAAIPVLPYQVVTEAEARAIMEGTIAARRNYTKGQKAFIGVLFHPELLEAKKGRPTKIATEYPFLSQEDVATKYGVSVPLLKQSIEIHKAIKGKSKAAREVEAQVFSGMGLGAILSGLGGKSATKNKVRRPSNMGTANEAVRSLKSRLSEFDDWEPQHKTIIVESLMEAISQSDELKEMILSNINTNQEEK